MPQVAHVQGFPQRAYLFQQVRRVATQQRRQQVTVACASHVENNVSLGFELCVQRCANVLQGQDVGGQRCAQRQAKRHKSSVLDGDAGGQALLLPPTPERSILVTFLSILIGVNLHAIPHDALHCFLTCTFSAGKSPRLSRVGDSKQTQ